MADWTVDSFIRQLRDGLAARPSLQTLVPKVRVLTYWPSRDESITDAIVIGYAAQDSNEPAALGQGRFRESVTVSCEIRVVRSGGGENVAERARARAMDLLGEVDHQLRTTPPAVGDQTERAWIIRREMDQFPTNSTEGSPVRVCLIGFDIEYAARTSAAS